jgi:hypothetical protein
MLLFSGILQNYQRPADLTANGNWHRPPNLITVLFEQMQLNEIRLLI